MNVKIDSFENFSASDYLQEYYSTIGKENKFLLDFLHDIYYRLPMIEDLIEVGGGPTLYQLISASEKLNNITIAEFHPENRKACELWLKRSKKAFDWNPFLEHVRDLEGLNKSAILEKRMRKKINRVIPCNLFSKNPIGTDEKFDVVSMHFCAESITQSEKDFKKVMTNCLRLLQDGGYIVMSFLEGASYYRVGERNFPAYPLTRDYLINFLENHNFKDIKIAQIKAEDNRDYLGFISVSAKLIEVLDQNKTPLFTAVDNHVKNNITPFHVPGHKMGKGIPELVKYLGKKTLKIDLNSMKDIDDLSQPISVIKEAQELAADLFGADDAYFLVNGTTSGVQAMILSQFQRGEKILLPRNLHKSAFNALILSGATPVYIPIYYDEEYQISGSPKKEIIEKLLIEQPDIKGVFLLNPSYYGVCGDLKSIIEVCHKRNKVVLVDEAHGTHFSFHKDLPLSAMAAGADMAVVSMHKTGGSLTQSSILLTKKKNISKLEVKRWLSILNSTSASYLLMVSLDLARRQLALSGKRLIGKTLKKAHYLREEINKIPGLKSYGKEICDPIKGINYLDDTKIFIDVRGWNITGFQLERILVHHYKIQIELADMYYVFVLITFGDDERSIEKILSALRSLSKKHVNSTVKNHSNNKHLGLPEVVLHPRDAFYGERFRTELKNSIGKISAESIMVYPPGIPVILAGERISKNIYNYLMSLKEEKVIFHGNSDPKLETILLIESRKRSRRKIINLAVKLLKKQ